VSAHTRPRRNPRTTTTTSASARARGVQEALLAEAPERFSRPPYVGHRGWLGVYLDVLQDQAEIAEIVADAYRTIAPKRLVTRLE
jgi:hypothetical protein